MLVLYRSIKDLAHLYSCFRDAHLLGERLPQVYVGVGVEDEDGLQALDGGVCEECPSPALAVGGRTAGHRQLAQRPAVRIHTR